MTASKDQAIQLALQGNWEKAIELNQQLLNETPSDIETLNRMAFAFIALGKSKDAMKAYEKTGWLDHVQDIETGEVIQEGTPVSQVNMNHMDEGIFTNREAVILHEAQIADAQKEIKVLKDATLNNMVNNVFLINFNTVTSVAITSGIYDSVARKIYV